jgi:hypothetical protein
MSHRNASLSICMIANSFMQLLNMPNPEMRSQLVSEEYNVTGIYNCNIHNYIIHEIIIIITTNRKERVQDNYWSGKLAYLVLDTKANVLEL